MNVTKGDKAIVIKGAAMGSIVEVGEYIAPFKPFHMPGSTQLCMVEDHSHWCTSLGGPMKSFSEIGMFTPDLKQVGSIGKRTTMLQVQPLEDEVLRKLTEVEETELLKTEVPA
jgi:hypothetical protein